MGKGRIPIKAAERLSEQYDCPMVLVFSIHPDREHFTVTSYGQTKAYCRLAAGYADKLADAILSGSISAALQAEPKHLPDVPMEWEGVPRR